VQFSWLPTAAKQVLGVGLSGRARHKLGSEKT
jgi:hypothetical protein